MSDVAVPAVQEGRTTLMNPYVAGACVAMIAAGVTAFFVSWSGWGHSSA
ncbi:hypothetical protein OK074_9027 [Actinobacteria bacterium OK074]|nr:hypothetical protein OK074_9027 [Actinobacteria bacterium OK074]